MTNSVCRRHPRILIHPFLSSSCSPSNSRTRNTHIHIFMSRNSWRGGQKGAGREGWRGGDDIVLLWYDFNPYQLTWRRDVAFPRDILLIPIEVSSLFAPTTPARISRDRDMLKQSALFPLTLHNYPLQCTCTLQTPITLSFHTPISKYISQKPDYAVASEIKT